jgi:predicted acetyltransferase
MALRVRTVRNTDEFAAAVGSIGHYFGWIPTADEAERFNVLLPLDRTHAVFDDGRIVAGAGAFPFELTIPGGQVSCAGVTVVGVHPTHRRQGLLRKMMTQQLEDIRRREEPLAALWASEDTIYGRYGYGQASHRFDIRVPKSDVQMRADLPPREGVVRFVDTDDALRVFPRIYQRSRRRTTGFISRSRPWWENRILSDRPEYRFGAGPLNRVLCELDGRPASYALYRIVQSQTEWKRTLRVLEAIGDDGAPMREIWRFLLGIDWMHEIQARLLSLDHPLRHFVARPRDLALTVNDGLWLRIVDVQASLAARSYAIDGRVTLEVVADPYFRENVGVWTIENGRVRRSSRRPDVRLDIEALGSVYLGGFSFDELARGERLEEAARGGLARADAMFRTPRAPWCPEIF